MIELVNNDNDKIELHKFRILKNFIKENIESSEQGDLKINNVFFTEDLLKLIKYIDVKFYKELQQRVDK